MSEDLGNSPTIINIHKDVCQNKNFRKAIWTGDNLQVTVMSIPTGGEIGLEIHNELELRDEVEAKVISFYDGILGC